MVVLRFKLLLRPGIPLHVASLRSQGYTTAQAGISAASGGAGGGGTRVLSSGGAGTTGQGFAGGTFAYDYNPANDAGNCWSTAGGGGAGGFGGNSAANGVTAGAGGAGAPSAISGAYTSYAGGGGGSVLQCTTGQGAGGIGGGGAGTTSVTSQLGNAGAPNTGGGGGGIGPATIAGAAANGGGSGVVIVRYTEPQSTSPLFGVTVPVASFAGGTNFGFHCPTGAFVTGITAHAYAASLNSFSITCFGGVAATIGSIFTGTAGPARSCATGGYTGAMGYVGADPANPGTVSGFSLYCSDTAALQTVGNAGLSGTPTSVLPFQCPFGQRIISVSGYVPWGTVVQGLYFTCGYAGSQALAIADYTGTLVTTPVAQARAVAAVGRHHRLCSTGLPPGLHSNSQSGRGGWDAVTASAHPCAAPPVLYVRSVSQVSPIMGGANDWTFAFTLTLTSTNGGNWPLIAGSYLCGDGTVPFRILLLGTAEPTPFLMNLNVANSCASPTSHGGCVRSPGQEHPPHVRSLLPPFHKACARALRAFWHRSMAHR